MPRHVAVYALLLSRRRVTRSPDYYNLRSEQDELAPPRSPRTHPTVRDLDRGQEGDEGTVAKSRRVESGPAAEPAAQSASNTLVQAPESGEVNQNEHPDRAEREQHQEGEPSGWSPDKIPLPDYDTVCCEVSFNIYLSDVQDYISCLWSVLAECANRPRSAGSKWPSASYPLKKATLQGCNE